MLEFAWFRLRPTESLCRACVQNEARFFNNDTKCHNDPVNCANTLNSWINTTSTHLKQVRCCACFFGVLCRLQATEQAFQPRISC